MTEVAKIEPAQEVAQHQDSMSNMIERVASDPNVPIEKLERMLDMQERIWAKQARDAFYADFARMQAEMPEIPKRGEIKVRGVLQSTYPLFEDIVERAKPVMQKHGFSLFHKSRIENGEMIVTGILAHKDGHSEADEIPLPYDTSGNKNATQVRGSTLSYGKRYTASNLLLITSRGEDDDGHKAGGGETITEDQFLELRNMIEEAEADEGKFLKFLRVDHLETLPQSQYGHAVAALTKKIKAKKEAAQ